MGCGTSQLKQANADTTQAELVIVVASLDAKQETAVATPDVKQETAVATPDPVNPVI